MQIRLFIHAPITNFVTVPLKIQDISPMTRPVNQGRALRPAQNAQQLSRPCPLHVFLHSAANQTSPSPSPFDVIKISRPQATRLYYTYIIQRNRPKTLVANSARCTVTG